MPDQPQPAYVIRTERGAEDPMSYDEVVRWVGVAISYRLEKVLCQTVQGRVIHEAATAAVNWLLPSLTQTTEVSGD